MFYFVLAPVLPSEHPLDVPRGGIQMTEQQLPCAALFGANRSAQMRTAIEEDTGEVCPCVAGRVCPLLGEVRPVVVVADAV